MLDKGWVVSVASSTLVGNARRGGASSRPRGFISCNMANRK